MLLELVGEFLALFLLELLGFGHFYLLLAKLTEFSLFSLIPSVLLLVLQPDSLVLLTQELLLLLGGELILIGVIEIVLELGRFFSEGLYLVANVLQLCSGFVQPNGKL